jgi:hypothetical protein
MRVWTLHTRNIISETGMPYQTKRRGVEAAGASTRDRAHCDAVGQEFDDFLRRSVHRMAHQCEQVPAPSQLFYDIAPERGRAASMRTIGAALAALAKCPTLPRGALVAFGNQLLAWFLSLQPMAAEAMMATWEEETKAQARADVAQARALHALETRDLAAIDGAIEETSQHLTETQRLLARLVAGRRTVIADRRESLHLMSRRAPVTT